MNAPPEGGEPREEPDNHAEADEDLTPRHRDVHEVDEQRALAHRGEQPGGRTAVRGGRVLEISHGAELAAENLIEAALEERESDHQPQRGMNQTLSVWSLPSTETPPIVLRSATSCVDICPQLLAYI